MKVIQTGKMNVVHSDGFVILDELTTSVYDVHFNKMTGYSLVERNSFNDNEPMYGKGKQKVDKIAKSFEATNRNLGVILSGNKGMGKTLFARKLCDKMLALGYPIIIVSEDTPNLAQFIDSIEQEVVVLFDEFEKVFRGVEHSDKGFAAQEALLPMFDGTSVGKKLFILTMNDTNKVSKFYLGRPGRFHYHIKFTYLSHDEVEEYFMREVHDEYKSAIKSVLTLTDRLNVNYDSLRAIAFEINLGEDVKEIIEDINLEDSFANQTGFRFTPIIYFTDGTVEPLNYTINAIGLGMNNNASVDYKEWTLFFEGCDIVVDKVTHNLCIFAKDIEALDKNDDAVDITDKIEKIEFIKTSTVNRLSKFL